MPEIAEINIIRKSLNKIVKDKTLEKIIIPDGSKYKGNMFNGYDMMKLPLKILSVKSKGKTLYLVFSNGGYLVIKLLLRGGIYLNKKPGEQVELIINGNTIYINDPMKFLYIRYCKDKIELNEELDKLGLDYMNDNITVNMFINTLKEHGDKTISDVLLDQSIFSGVGNYIMNEVLYKSHISPFTLVKNISDESLKVLFKSIIDIIHRAYIGGGVNMLTHTDMVKKGVNIKDFFDVYRKKVDKLGNKVIKRNRTDMSSYYYVPSIQK